MIELVTLDFHNTIAECDDWFQLEVRTLPTRVLAELAPDALGYIGAAKVTDAYRQMRHEVMSTGVEIEAVTGLERVFQQLGISASSGDVSEVVANLMHGALATTTPFPDIDRAISNLRAAGIRLGVISSAIYHPFLEWALTQLDLAEKMDFIVTSASAGMYKSDPNLYRHALAEVDVPAEHAVHIGDSAKWDIWSPQQIGMRAVLIPFGEPISPLQHDTDATPDYTATDAMDAARWVLQEHNRA